MRSRAVSWKRVDTRNMMLKRVIRVRIKYLYLRCTWSPKSYFIRDFLNYPCLTICCSNTKVNASMTRRQFPSSSLFSSFWHSLSRPDPEYTQMRPVCRYPMETWNLAWFAHVWQQVGYAESFALTPPAALNLCPSHRQYILYGMRSSYCMLRLNSE